ncbi:MAG: FMN-binding protein [Actinomycetia bacterium]|nr:FMN-binding protein [Actinomycetes bacterium]
MTGTPARMGLAALGSVAVIGGLIGAKTVRWEPAPATQPTVADSAAATANPSAAATPSPAASPSGAATPSPAATSSSVPSATGGTYTGDRAATRYGDVQVAIDVSSGHIDDIRVVKYPTSDRQCRAINQRAIPVLVAEALAAQSVNIDVVSGATYTSQGYQKSLQSAIDKAGL